MNASYDNIASKIIEYVYNRLITPPVDTSQNYYEYEWKYENNTIKLPIILSINLNPDPDVPDEVYGYDQSIKYGYCVNGYAFNSIDDRENYLDGIRIELSFSPFYNLTKQRKKHYKEILSELYDVVRHELQHIFQTDPNKISKTSTSTDKNRTNANTDRYAYSMLPDEFEALIYGFIFQANHENVPVVTIFQRNLNKWLANKEITDIQYQRLYTSWINHIKNNVPTIKI